MKQILQDLATGETRLAEVPAPSAPRRGVCVSTRCSLISSGTERMLVEFGRASWLEKARQQPEKVQQVLNKVRTDGLLPTLDAVRSKLDQPLPLGYCNVGVVTEVGKEVMGFSVGDRVVSNGPHAETVAVSRNLCARIPDDVSDEAAAFTVLGAIGLQGVRLAAPTVGESFVVIGLGLIGLITVQLLRANGCRVLGIDYDESKAELVRKFGCVAVDLGRGEDPLAAADMFSNGRGIDGVLITASTRSSDPVQQAARMCRRRARIVLVGVTGLELNRADFYEKELSFQVSCSYGPGRYDPVYEQEGIDYPLGFVRWTEQRNFEAVLNLMASGALNVQSLLTHEFAIEDAPRAYDLLATNSEPTLGILLRYPAEHVQPAGACHLPLTQVQVSIDPQEPRVAVIGAGNYAARILIPALVHANAKLLGIASSGGVTAAHFGRKFGFAYATTDTNALVADASASAVVVATRHDSHARYVQAALVAGKHVFVEKPLAITHPEIDAVEAARRALSKPPLVMVGFNRRFAPQVVLMKSLLDSMSEPKTMVVTVNAGAIPADHWTQNPGVGGGRIIGEGCHFIDLMRFLCGARIAGWHVSRLRGGGSLDDKISLTLEFADGSIGTLHYFANGHSAYPKERVEVFCGGRVLQLNNFRTLQGHGWKDLKRMKLWRQDKGQVACMGAFIAAIRTGAASPIPFEEIIEVARASVSIGEAARN